jgi:hypothetical protein
MLVTIHFFNIEVHSFVCKLFTKVESNTELGKDFIALYYILVTALFVFSILFVFE